MIRKYQKPFSRSLGEIIPSADGVCVNGSAANTGMPTGTDPGCFRGNVATGAGCSFGQTPSQIACTTGGIPQYFGCGYGLYAVSPCNTGQEPT